MPEPHIEEFHKHQKESKQGIMKEVAVGPLELRAQGRRFQGQNALAETRTSTGRMLGEGGEQGKSVGAHRPG